MDITIYPRLLQGTVNSIPSKSQAHRLLICAAFADTETMLICGECGKDIEATVRCLNALGAQITRETEGYRIIPVSTLKERPVLRCGESGSTLRFIYLSCNNESNSRCETTPSAAYSVKCANFRTK